MRDPRFPVLEMEMTAETLHIRLADEQSSLSATLPKVFVDGIVAKWQQFQRGESEEAVALSRNYTGSWEK